MIYVIHVYNVADVPAFTAAFENGPWQRLSLQLSGHLHTGLLLRSTLPHLFLSLGIWESEENYLAAEDTVEFREFHRLLKLLTASYQCIGAFGYHRQQDRAQIPSYSIRIPVAPTVQQARR